MSFQVPPSSSPPTTPGKTPGRANGGYSFLADHPSTTPAGPPPLPMFSTTPAGVPPPSATLNSSNFGTGKSLFSAKISSSSSGLKSGPGRLFKVSPKSTFGSAKIGGRLANGRNSKPSFLGAHRVEQTESASASEVEEEEEEDDGEDDAEGEEEEYEEEAEDEEYEERSEEGEEEEDEEEYDEDADGDYTQQDAEVDAEGEEDEDDYSSETSREPSREASADARGEDQTRTPKGFGKPRPPEFMSSAASATAPFDWAALAQEAKSAVSAAASASAKGTKRSRGGSSPSLIDTIEADLPPAKRRESVLPRVAKDLAKNAGTASLRDPDEVILGTEFFVQRLARIARAPPMAMDYQRSLSDALDAIPRDLIRLWKVQTSMLEPNDESFRAGIGPAEDSDGVTKAAFLAGMLLRLHCPQAVLNDGSSMALSSRVSGQRWSGSRAKISRDIGTPLDAFPRMFLDFLNTEHLSLEPAIKALYSYAPNATSSPQFWDTILAAVARGQLDLVVKVLQSSDFSLAWRPREEGAGHLGYAGAQLSLINQAVGRLSGILLSSPVVKDDDWEITGPSWSLFEKQVEEALAELSALQTSNQNSGFSLSGYGSSSGLPERIYSSLKVIYGVLLGRPAEILSVSLDWLEATLYLTIWWNGQDDEGPVNLKSSRRGSPNRRRGKRYVDANPTAAYLRRLAWVVDMVTNGPDDDSLMVDTTSVVEVGLATIFEGNIEGAIYLLQSLSLPITSAVLEIAKWKGWYITPPSNARPEGFDDSDLMVLSYAKPDNGVTGDDVLMIYSDQLFERADFKAGNEVREGWELAVDVSSRLESPEAAQKRIAWLIDRLTIETDARANKVTSVCQSFGMPQLARKVCENFADHVSTTSHNYGTALLYYARAHARKKCKDVLDLLISMCLVRSTAYPPANPDSSSRDLDEHLAALISSPQESIRLIASIDAEAAEILSEYISGYATLRRFYDLRDQEINPSTGSAAGMLRPKARRRAAAKAILACIASAADSIQGGLFDAELISVIQVDVLLALLAEASEFLGDHILSLQQLMALLRAIEDLQTVHARIRRQCEDCFRACLDAKFERADAGSRLDPSELLKKSVSGLTDSSGFSLIGSELSEGPAGQGDSMVLAKDTTPRAWDWRDKWTGHTSGEEVLRDLRQAIAKEVAALWIEEA